MERGGYDPRNRGGGRGGGGGYGRGRGRGRGSGGRGSQRPPQDAFDHGRRGGGRGGWSNQPPRGGGQWQSGPTPSGWRPTASPHGSGSGRGIPPSNPIPAAPFNPPPPAQTVTRVPNVTTMEPSDSEQKLSPVRRPDRGGKESIMTKTLQVNHFPVRFNPNATIFHYDVDVKATEPPRQGRPPKRITKSDLSMIREKLFDDHPQRLPLGMTAYDGEKSIFSKVRLPEETFAVDVSKGEDDRPTSYLVTLALVNTLELRKLDDYIRGRALSIPRVILQGVDLVFKENPMRSTVSVGRCFYPMTSKEKELQPGIFAAEGFQHSLKPTSQGLSLCLDYSVLSFRKSLPVLDYLAKCIRGFNVPEFGKFRRQVENVLVGLKVNVTHRKTKQKYTIARLTPRPARHTTFSAGDPPRDVNLLQYFQDRYPVDVLHKDLPALEFAGRMNYVPMELCVLAEGQRYPKDNLDWGAAKSLREMSLRTPEERQKLIQQMVISGNGPCGGDIINNFEMDVNTSMTTVKGRVIGPPELKVGNCRGSTTNLALNPKSCDWNLVGKSMVEVKPIECWSILDFAANSDRGFNADAFINKFVEKYRNLGVAISRPDSIQRTKMSKLGDFNSLCQLLETITNGVQKGRRLQFLLCVMANRDPGYKRLKWISETKVGIVTQCCLSSNTSKLNDQYLTNLALKINAKLGGSNVELVNRPVHFEGGGHVMFIGADVNHPGSRDTSSPSIAAVVGTVNWPAANRYAARVCAQGHRIEKILNFGEVCLNLVECYGKLNGVRPEKIVIFRDGVSESQFQMVLGEELMDLKSVFTRSNYFPTITLIVAQKRHQTRLFPAAKKDGNPRGNVLPGTVVDTVIIHPFEFDFYLVSHNGFLGTSKPTHYHVLWDEHSFTSDKLQKLIYDTCFTFARCTKPVSLVPPVYYADLAAYRGRLYYEAKVEMQSPSSAGASSSSSSSPVASSSFSSSTSNDPNCFKLHEKLKDAMFFI